MRGAFSLQNLEESLKEFKQSRVIIRGGVKDTRLEAKDSPIEDRPSRGQGQECSRPRPRTQAHSGANFC